jgi:hypothetical protein
VQKIGGLSLILVLMLQLSHRRASTPCALLKILLPATKPEDGIQLLAGPEKLAERMNR